MFVTGWDDKAADQCLDLALKSRYAKYYGGMAEDPVFLPVVTKRRGKDGRDTDVVMGEDGMVVVSSSITTEDTKMTKTEVGDAAGERKKRTPTTARNLPRRRNLRKTDWTVPRRKKPLSMCGIRRLLAL